MLKVGAAIVIGMAVAALVGPWLSPWDPARQELSVRLAGPTVSHPFGLDELGRDILARVLAGARISFFVALVVVSVSSVVGTVLGALAGYFGGLVDELISRVTDTLMAFPGILLAIALVAVLGPSLINVVFALTIIGWVGYARLVRSQVLGPASSSRPGGTGAGADTRVLLRHIIRRGASGSRRSGHARHGGGHSRRRPLQLSWAGVQPPTQLGSCSTAAGLTFSTAPHLTLFPGSPWPCSCLVSTSWETGCGIWPIRKG